MAGHCAVSGPALVEQRTGYKTFGPSSDFARGVPVQAFFLRSRTDRMSGEWHKGVLAKADQIVTEPDFPLDVIKALFELGHEDAVTFATQTDFGRV